MQPVKLGIVGCGVIGPHHMQAAAASELIELVAVADLIEDRAKAAAEKFGVPRTFREGADLIQDPGVEAVVLAFPADHRTELALHAFSCGKHVLTEKPVAMNAGEVRRMIAARGDLVAACCSSRYRFPEGAQIAADFIAGGELGDLRCVYCRELRAAGPAPEGTPPDWRLIKARNGGGILMNWGCYDLDYLLGICGWQLVPRTAFAQTWTVPPRQGPNVYPGSDAETYYTALVRCEGGTILSIERGEYMPIASEAAWQVIGTHGALRLHMTAQTPKLVHVDATATAEGTGSRVLWEGTEGTALVHAGPTTDFAAAIREGRPPKTTLEQALVVQRISDAVYRSAETGTAVEV